MLRLRAGALQNSNQFYNLPFKSIQKKKNSRCRETGPLKLAALSAEETELMEAMAKRLDTLASRAAALGMSIRVDRRGWSSPLLFALTHRFTHVHDK